MFVQKCCQKGNISVFMSFGRQKMLPKRQQKRKIGQKRAVNIAKKATFTGPANVELIYSHG